MGKRIIISMNMFLTEIEAESLEIDGMENCDCKSLLELGLTYVANSYNERNDKSAQDLAKSLIERLGIEVVLSSSTPVKIMKFLYKIILRLQFDLKSLSLENVDLRYEMWLGRDMVVSYVDNPIKLLPR